MRRLWNSGFGRTRLGGFRRFVPAAVAGVIGMLMWVALAGGTQPYETYAWLAQRMPRCRRAR